MAGTQPYLFRATNTGPSGQEADTMRAAFHRYLDRSNGDAVNGSTMTPQIRSLIGR
jgi:hypothetical protein